jgi:hypothetical protein
MQVIDNVLSISRAHAGVGRAHYWQTINNEMLEGGTCKSLPAPLFDPTKQRGFWTTLPNGSLSGVGRYLKGIISGVVPFPERRHVLAETAHRGVAHRNHRPPPAQLTKTPRPAPAPPPAEVVIDVKQAYGGVTFRTIGRAMAEAVRALHGGSSCTVFLAAGQKRPCR